MAQFKNMTPNQKALLDDLLEIHQDGEPLQDMIRCLVLLTGDFKEFCQEHELDRMNRAINLLKEAASLIESIEA